MIRAEVGHDTLQGMRTTAAGYISQPLNPAFRPPRKHLIVHLADFLFFRPSWCLIGLYNSVSVITGMTSHASSDQGDDSTRAAIPYLPLTVAA